MAPITVSLGRATRAARARLWLRPLFDPACQRRQDSQPHEGPTHGLQRGRRLPQQESRTHESGQHPPLVASQPAAIGREKAIAQLRLASEQGGEGEWAEKSRAYLSVLK